jgi:hypothetical protein
VDIAAHPGGDLQHAFGDVMFGLSRRSAVLDVVNQRESPGSGRNPAG